MADLGVAVQFRAATSPPSEAVYETTSTSRIDMSDAGCASDSLAPSIWIRRSKRVISPDSESGQSRVRDPVRTVQHGRQWSVANSSSEAGYLLHEYKDDQDMTRHQGTLYPHQTRRSEAGGAQ